MIKFEGREIVSIPEACKRVGVNRRTIYNWLHADKVEYIKTAGGHVRIFADTLFTKERISSDEKL